MKLVSSICLILFANLLSACTGMGTSHGEDSSSVSVITYEDTIVITPSKTEPRELKEGYAYGKIEPCIHNEKAEQNLITQSSSYNHALLVGDTQNCKRYMWPKAISYYRKYYHDLTNDQIMDEFFKAMSNDYVEMVRRARNQGIEFEIVISNFEKKITYKDYTFILFNVSSNLIMENFTAHSTTFDKTLGISENDGKNWWIVAVNEDTPNILSDFPQKVINEIMGY